MPICAAKTNICAGLVSEILRIIVDETSPTLLHVITFQKQLESLCCVFADLYHKNKQIVCLFGF